VSSYGPVGGLQGTNPTTVLRRARDRGMKLVVIDPRRTELATFADIHLQVRPGEDAAVLAGFLRVILTEDLHDTEFCEQWVDGLDQLRLDVDPFTPDVVAERAGIDADDLVAAARMFAAGTRGTLGTGTGPNMAPNPSLTEHLAISCNIVCGRVNREGDRLEAGAFLYPGTPRKAQAIAPRDPRTGASHRFRGLRGYIGEMLCSVAAEEILEPGDGQIRALIVSGGNPAVAWPDQALTMAALRDLELLVVVDHRMTATAREAHYVIAPRLSLERADVPHLMDRWFAAPYTNYTDAVVEPDGDVLNEWEVFWGLARRLGTELRTAGGDLAAVDQPTDHDVIDMVYARARMSTDEIRANRGVLHPDRELVVQPADPDCTDRFDIAPESMMTVLADLVSQQTGAEGLEGFDPDLYPFRLVSRRLKAVINSLGIELPNLAAKGTTNRAYMHPDDLASLSLADGDLVEITSPTGQIIGVCEAAPDVRRGVVSMAHSWGDGSLSDEKVRDIGTPTSRLTSTTAAHDPITGMVVQSAIPVSVVAAEPQPA
ncbi:MAG: molybdopterin-containing oxidoreductase family protein, partial [Acidimicrobiales bacterium]